MSTPLSCFSAPLFVVFLLLCFNSQGPFDILLLKLTDVMTCALYSSDSSLRRAADLSLSALRSSLARLSSPSQPQPLTVIEPFERVEAVLNRAGIQRMIERMQEGNGKQEGKVTIPAAFLYQHRTSSSSSPSSSSAATSSPFSSPLSLSGMTVHSALPSSVPYPLICKSIAACGTPSSHRMYVLHRAEDFAVMRAHEQAHRKEKVGNTSSHDTTTTEDEDSVWIVQQYISHSAVLYKVYVLDEEVKIVAKVRMRRRKQNIMRRRRRKERKRIGKHESITKGNRNSKTIR